MAEIDARLREDVHLLGELLGVTRESVVRAMSALEAEGCITRLGRTYCELKPAALKDICDAA